MVRPPAWVPLPMVEEAVALKLKIVARPVFEMLNSVVVALAVEEPIANNVFAVSPLLVWIANFANGELVPTPILPEVGSLNAVEVAGTVPNRKLPMLSWLLAVVDGKNMFEPMPMLPPPEVMIV